MKSVDLSKIDIGNLGPGKIDIPDMPQVEAPKIEVPSVARGDMTWIRRAPATLPMFRSVRSIQARRFRSGAGAGRLGGGTPTHIADGGHIGGHGSTPGGGFTPGGGALPDAPTGGGDSITGGPMVQLVAVRWSDRWGAPRRTRWGRQGVGSESRRSGAFRC